MRPLAAKIKGLGAGNSVKCPIPQSELTRVGNHWIYPEHGQVSSAKQRAPLRIFLTCGHGRNEEWVRRTKADLEKWRSPGWESREKGVS